MSGVVDRPAAFAAALLDPGMVPPRGLRAWNGSDVARRFAVHRNNVVGSLVQALAEGFPVVQALVGPEFFGALAAEFVRRQPPRSPVMADYGAELPEFIERFAPARSLPYLADVARLERARLEACHAADAALLCAADVAGALADPERIGELRLRLHPAARLVVSPHPIVSLWAAHQGEGALADVDLRQAEAALVLRPLFDVLVVRCDPGTARFVACLQEGATLGPAAAQAAGCAGFDLAATLSLLLAHGALAGREQSEEITP